MSPVHRTQGLIVAVCSEQMSVQVAVHPRLPFPPLPLPSFLMKVLVFLMRSSSLDIAQMSLYLHFHSLACQQLRWRCRPDEVFTQEELGQHLERVCKVRFFPRGQHGYGLAPLLGYELGIEIYQQVVQWKAYVLNLRQRPRKSSSPFSLKRDGEKKHNRSFKWDNIYGIYRSQNKILQFGRKKKTLAEINENNRWERNSRSSPKNSERYRAESHLSRKRSSAVLLKLKVHGLLKRVQFSS